MPATYTIEIFNQSGVEQDYTLFPARPLVSGSASGEIWSHVVSSQKAVPNGASVTFEVTDNYYAFCGHYDNPPTEGAKIVVEETVPVTLGTSYGTSFTMGSTVNLTVLGGKASKISTPVPPGKGKLGNFVIDTTLTPGNEFKIVEAKQNRLLVGVGMDDAEGKMAPIGTFTPYPNALYQILPLRIFHVAAGQSIERGQLVRAESMDRTIVVDFNLRGTPEVRLRHDEYNSLSFLMG